MTDNEPNVADDNLRSRDGLPSPREVVQIDSQRLFQNVRKRHKSLRRARRRIVGVSCLASSLIAMLGLVVFSDWRHSSQLAAELNPETTDASVAMQTEVGASQDKLAIHVPEFSTLLKIQAENKEIMRLQKELLRLRQENKRLKSLQRQQEWWAIRAELSQSDFLAVSTKERSNL